MKKFTKKSLSLLLALLMCLTIVPFSALTATAGEVAAPEKKIEDYLANAACQTDCDGDCGHSPSIVVHGINQSIVRIADENGNYITDADGKNVTNFPPSFDVMAIVKKVIFPALKTLILQKDMGLSAAVSEVISIAFEHAKHDENGQSVYDVRTEKYPYSLAAASQSEKDEIYDNLPLNAYTAVAGEDHLYYFAYNSFGNVLDISAELADFIELVKIETGHNKVNILPISLGGAIVNALWETQMDKIEDSIDKIVYIVPAADGSQIVGDIFDGKFNYADEMLYNQMMPGLVDGYMGYLINIFIRILPKQVLFNTLAAALASAADVLKTCTNLWALTPAERYEELADKHLPAEEFPELRRQTDIFHNAQLNKKANLTYLTEEKGVRVFDIVDYDYPLYNVVESWDKYNADGIINVDSASFGAYSVPLGQTFPADYTAKGDYCTCGNPSNHIAPTNNLDASAGLFCETTWYFRGQDHEKTGRNDIIINLTIELLLYDEIENVYSDTRYPQFMDGRNASHLKDNLLKQANTLLNSGTLSAQDAAELSAAIEAANTVLGRGTDSYDEFLKVQENLDALLIKHGVRQPAEPESFFDKILYTLLKTFSDFLYKNVGPNGYSDINKK